MRNKAARCTDAAVLLLAVPATLVSLACAPKCAFTQVRIEAMNRVVAPTFTFDYCDNGGDPVRALSAAVIDLTSRRRVCAIRFTDEIRPIPRQWTYGTAIPSYAIDSCGALEIGHTYLVEVVSAVGPGRRRFKFEGSGILSPLDPPCLTAPK